MGGRDEQRDEAFSAFARGAWPGLVRMAWLILDDERRAEDAAQSGLFGVWSNWSRIDSGRHLAYARKSVTNAALTDLRGAKRRPATITDSVPEHADHLDVAETVTGSQALRSALSELPPRARAILVLRYLEDLTEADVATTLGISVGTVKSTTSRSLVRIREVFTVEEAGR